MPRPDLPAGRGPLLPCQGPFLPLAGQAWDGSEACSLLCREHQRRRRHGSSFDQEGAEDAPANIHACRSDPLQTVPLTRRFASPWTAIFVCT